jgi:hypothetical protein
MVGELANVLEEPVEVRGGAEVEILARGHIHARGEDYALVGDHAIGIERYVGGAVHVQLRKLGDGGLLTARAFAGESAARAEFERLKAQLFARQWVAWATTLLVEAGVLPEEFKGAVLTGDAQALLVAADWRDDRGEESAAILLRSAYHMVTGQANVEVKAGKGKVIVLNPQVVTRKFPAKPTVGPVRAAVVEVGKSVRIVSTEVTYGAGGEGAGCVQERIFRLGDQAEYDSFNLVYYAPVKSISAKTVVIDRKGDRGGSDARLTLAKFVEKNHDFDLAKAKKRNDEWTD